MLKMVKNFLIRKGLIKNPYKIQSFTFYVPAPPQRNTGYREKQFDQTFFEFINHGFKIISTHTQAHVGANHSGMWFICIVQPLTEEACNINLLETTDQVEKTEGLYHLEY